MMNGEEALILVLSRMSRSSQMSAGITLKTINNSSDVTKARLKPYC